MSFLSHLLPTLPAGRRGKEWRWRAFGESDYLDADGETVLGEIRRVRRGVWLARVGEKVIAPFFEGDDARARAEAAVEDWILERGRGA